MTEIYVASANSTGDLHEYFYIGQNTSKSEILISKP
jgi:hypothetical protein